MEGAPIMNSTTSDAKASSPLPTPWPKTKTVYARKMEHGECHGWACHYCNVPLWPLDKVRDFLLTLTPDADGWIKFPGVSPAGEEYPCFDHKVPKSRGGSNNPDNLVLCCHLCNSKKGVKDYAAFKARMESEATE